MVLFGFSINNNAKVIARAIAEFFIHGTPAEETVNAATDILDFQLISKASGLYSRCFQIIDGREVEMQRVNRVYATDDWEHYGTLYKVHSQTGTVSKIPSLPLHCLVDNNNHLTLDAVDRQWYIREANEKIQAFQGIQPTKVNTRKINSLAKQALALFAEPEQKGNNDGQESKQPRSKRTRSRKAAD